MCRHKEYIENETREKDVRNRKNARQWQCFDGVE